MDNKYVDPICRKYADLLMASCPRLKSVWFGTPTKLGVSSLPALVVEQVSSKTRFFDTDRDRHDVRIRFTVVTDVRSTVSDDMTVIPGEDALQEVMAGRNADYTLKPESVLYAIRHAVELDPTNSLRTDLSGETDVTFAIVPNKAKDAWSVQGQVSVVATHVALR